MNATQPQITLTWDNKHTPALPAPAEIVLRETFAPSHPLILSPSHPLNALYHGDNLPVLARLLADGWAGRFRLIYADPPYNSGGQWTRKVRLRGPRSRNPGSRGQGASSRAVVDQQPQYDDAWDESAYLQFLYERLPLLRDLLAEDGSLWLHCDHRHAHHVRCLLEEVFGARNFLNTITWRSQTARGAKVNAFYFANSAQALHIFAKDRSAPTCWTPARKTLVLSEAQAAAEFMRDERGFFRTSDPGTFSFESLQRLHAEGRLYAPYGGEVLLDAAARRVWCSKGGNIGVKYYLADLGHGRFAVERGVDNIWDDIPGLGTTPGEDLGYPTQKTEALLRRVVQTATRPGDWVLDPFGGSGTTLAVAQKLHRRWVGCDTAYGAVQTARRRLLHVIQAQAAVDAANAADVANAANAANASDVGRACSPTFLPAANSANVGLQARPTIPAPASNPHVARDFAVYGAALPPSPAPAAANLPQVHLSITPIAGEAARIRVAVEQVAWPEAQAAALNGADWRAAVEEIAIDPDYDGCTLRILLADAPLKRTQWVAGEYTLPAPPPGAQVAVRVTDIWGQETMELV